jgi:cell division protein FtsQ
VAKIDSQANRVTAFADDEAAEQYFRPTPSSPARAKTQASAAKRSADSGDDGFLRARRRVPVRRSFVPATRFGRIAAATGVVVVVAGLVWLGISIRDFFREDPRFRIASSSSIQFMGNTQVARSELLSVFGSDLGRNIFFVPLSQRRNALEQLPWVEHATVMRLLPDQLRVSIVERVPVAFVRQGNTIGLVDAQGVLLPLPAGGPIAKHYSFPVVTGIAASEPLSVRAARMHQYQQFINDLDSGGSKLSSQLSEVDISNTEDIWALLPSEGADIQVLFGDSDFLARYRSFQRQLPVWKQQYPHLASVDMRDESQIVLDVKQQAPSEHAVTAKHPPVRPAGKSPKTAKAKSSAG